MDPLRPSRRAWQAAPAVMALLALGCRGEEAPLTIHAAASLADVLPRVALLWTSSSSSPSPREDPRFHFGASSRLAKQIEAGAPGDAFFSADDAWMDYLAERGLIARDTRVEVAGNQLVVVVPRNASFVPTSPRALVASDASLHRLALAGEGVPAGRYARAALDEAGVLTALRGKIVSADDVRMALAWVARGEADAGVVYATDAKAEPRVKVAFAFSPGSHPPIRYPAAVLARARHEQAAKAFLEHCQSDEARALFLAAGFGPPRERAP